MGNLVNITETKVYLQATGTATDALINAYIGYTEAEIEAYVDRNLVLGTYTEVVDYKQSKFDKSGYTMLDASLDAPKLFLDNYPITTITSIVDGGVTQTASTYTYDSENGVLSPQNQLSEPTVTYVAGYTTVTAPSALKLVVMQGVKSLFENNNAASSNSGNVKSKRIKDFSVDYGNAQSGYVLSLDGSLMKNYLASNSIILNRYKKVNI